MRNLRSALVIAAVLVAAFTSGALIAQDDGDGDLRPVSELQYVRVLPGESYWSLHRRLGLSCPAGSGGTAPSTYLWEFNNRRDLSVNAGIFVPPECVPGTPPTTTTTTTTLPPRPERDVLVGASAARRDGMSWADSTLSFEAATGAPMEIGRRFASTFPTGSFTSLSQFSVDVGARHRWISVKGDPTLVDWLNFLPTIPDDGYDTWVTINHEPENDGGSMTPTRFRSKLRLMDQAIQEIDRDDIHSSLVLMSWLERDSDPATSSALWFPESDIIHRFTLGLDPYDPNGSRTPAALVDATLALWEQAGGGPWMITETGTKRTGSDGAAWITSWGDYCWVDLDCGGLMYFHSSVGTNGPWWLDDPVMRAAWGELALRTAA